MTIIPGAYPVVREGKRMPDKQLTKKKGLFFRGRRLGRLLLLAVLLLAASALFLERNLEGVILTMAQARVRAMAVEVLNQSVRQVMGSSKSYEELVTVRSDQAGSITMVQANAALMNDLATATALLAQEKLLSSEDDGVDIPLGAALGIPFLAALGPAVHVRLVPVGAVTAAFTSEFESAGINQTRHKIYLSMQTRVQLVLPAGGEQMDFSSQVLIAESIIVGRVPESFLATQSDSALSLDLTP